MGRKAPCESLRAHLLTAGTDKISATRMGGRSAAGHLQ